MDNAYCKNCGQRIKGDAALRRLRGVLARLKRNVKPTRGGKLGIIWEFRTKCSRGLYCNTLSQKKNQVNEYGEELEQYLCTLAYSEGMEDELEWTLRQLRDYFPIACDSVEEGRKKLKG